MLDIPRSETVGDIASPAIFNAGRAKFKGIAVLGSHPTTVARAPFDDEGWLIYACSPDNSPHGLSNHAKALPRVDQFFEIHEPIGDKSRPFAYLNWLTTQPFVWIRDKKAIKSFPGGRLYPDEQMRGRKVIHPDGRVEFTPGEFHRSQFKSSIAFMMAKAIMDCLEQDIPAIGLWGILQRGGKHEYEIQRPSTQYFLEEAVRRGIDARVSPESMLLHDDPEDF